MNRYCVYLTLIIFTLGCSEQSKSRDVNDPTSIPDFFAVEAGKEYPARIDTSMKNSNSLPYYYFEAPLPKTSVIEPFRHYTLSISKETNVVHSKVLSEPISTQGCMQSKNEMTLLLESQGFTKTNEPQAAAPFANETYINKDQIAVISCTKQSTSPFWEINLRITTNEEHLKFETAMQNYRS